MVMKNPNANFLSPCNENPLYRCWKAIKQRTTNSNHESYKNYGARKITMCEAWFRNFRAFAEFAIASGWKPELEIDRIDNDGGYEPKNVRFVPPKINMTNQRAKPNSTGLPRGVVICNGRYTARIRIHHERKYLGFFDTPEQASAAYEQALKTKIQQYTDEFHAEVSENPEETLRLAKITETRRLIANKAKNKLTRIQRAEPNKNRRNNLPDGVYPCGNKFRTQIGIDKKVYHLGVFETAEHASKVYEAAKADRDRRYLAEFISLSNS